MNSMNAYSGGLFSFLWIFYGVCDSVWEASPVKGIIVY